MAILSETATTVTFRTYVYYIKYNSVSQQINTWYPSSPQNVIFAYTTLYSGDPLPTSITGDYYICDSGQSYYINGTQPATWTHSSNVILDSGQGTSSAQFRSIGSGEAWVRATIPNECGDPKVITKYLYAGPEEVFFGIGTIPYCWYVNDVITVVADYYGGWDYQWNVSGGTILSGQGTQSIEVRADWNALGVDCYLTGPICGGPFGYASEYLTDCYGFSSISTSPNPATNSLTVELTGNTENTQPYQIEIRNNTGDVIKSYMASGNKFVINIKDVPNGMYILRILHKEGILNRRIIIEK